jgi:hypothetical protein
LLAIECDSFALLILAWGSSEVARTMYEVGFCDSQLPVIFPASQMYQL